MMKRLTLSFLLGSAFSLGICGMSYAQTTIPDTDQTDRSEEDWRKSQKKDSTDPFDPFKNTQSIGIGTNLPPLREIDMLPEDSRRHLMRERAKVIAEMEIGQEINAPYVPSDAAKSDPELAAEEEAAWEVIVTDMKSTGGAPSPDAGTGPNKVAVTGTGGSAPSSPIRGGSAQSAAEIMAMLKGMQTGGSNGNHQGGTPATQDAARAAQETARAKAQDMAQERAIAKAKADLAKAEADAAAATAEAAQAKADNARMTNTGSAQNSDTEAAAVEAAMAANEAARQAGEAKAAADAAAKAQAEAEAAAAQAAQEAQNANDAAQSASDTEDAAEQAAQNTPQPEEFSPLSLPRSDTQDSDTSGSESSAAAYLRSIQNPQ